MPNRDWNQHFKRQVNSIENYEMIIVVVKCKETSLIQNDYVVPTLLELYLTFTGIKK